MRKRSGGVGGAVLHHHHRRRASREKAKNRVDDLQGMFADVQSAHKEGRSTDAAVLEEQLHQLLREWKAELGEPSPAASAASSLPVSNLPPLPPSPPFLLLRIHVVVMLSLNLFYLWP